VFPESFAPFLLGNPAVREVFMKHHADLLEASFWQGHKERIQAGYVHDVFPYERERRFSRRHPPAAAGAPARNIPAAREKTSQDALPSAEKAG
jgi:isocitrate dehydrogenase kinase/phosphatase